MTDVLFQSVSLYQLTFLLLDMEEHLNMTKRNNKRLLRFNLKQTHDKEQLTQIMLITTVNRHRIRVYTRLRIEPKYWDRATYRCKVGQPMSMRDKARLTQINRLLSKLELSIQQIDNQLAETGKYLNIHVIRNAVKENQSIKKEKQQPVAYLYKQVEDYEKSLNRRGKRGISSTQRTYSIALKRLENFCSTQKYPLHSFEDFDSKFFSAFKDYLYSCYYQKGEEQKQYTQNTVINTLKVIKNLLHRSYDNEMTDNNYFQKVQTVLSSDTSEQVYLQENEIKKLADMKLDIQHERNVRDMFVIACYTALRISDIQKLNEAVIRDGSISLYQTKTKEQVEIPILKEIAPLVAQYQKSGFPVINICQANETIKELAKRCGISQTINYKEHRGGTVQIKALPKWKMITFHTARRSCVTNLYKRGYPVNYIMMLSGHRSIQSFQRYMRATSKEVMNNFMTLLKKNKAL